MVLSARSAPRPEGVLVTADDFGLTPKVSRAILDLAGRGRLSAAGAMTGMAAWADHAASFAALPIDQGVHLNLTVGQPVGPMPRLAPSGVLPSLRRVAELASTGRLDVQEVTAEFTRQVDRFAQRLGRLPDYLDGHQHVHVLPGVRSALLATIATLWAGHEPPYVRDPADSPGAMVVRGIAVAKAGTVAALATGFGRRLRRSGIETNDGFAGFSPFDPGRDFGADFRRFLVAPGARHMVMCHPGLADDDVLATIDPVVATRPKEHLYLSSARFIDDLSEAGLRLCRYGELIGLEPST